MEEGDGARLLDDLVQLVGHRTVVGEEALDAGVELEALHPVLLDQAAGLAYARLAAEGVDGGEGDEDVGVGGGRFGDLFVRDGFGAGRGLGVDREDDGGHLPLAVVRGGLLQGRFPLALDLEVGGGGVVQVVVQGGVALGGHLRMGVDVDRDESVEVHRGCHHASGSFGAGMPTDWSSAPTEVGKASARVSGVQPPSA